MLTFFLLVFLFLSQPYKCFEKNCLNVAVSSNFLSTFKLIVDEFEIKYSCKINVCSDSTANLFNKIKNNAPFDVFISADAKHPILLEQHVLNKSYIYAYGFLVLFNIKYTIKKNFLRDKKFFLNVSLANTSLSPYGYSTECVLNNLKLKINIVVTGLNINQVYHCIVNNSSFTGFVALSQVIHNNLNNFYYYNLPVYLYPVIEQRFILLKNKETNNCLLKFFDFFNTFEVKKIISKYGYKF